jgi:hypothetical protein
VVVAALRHGPRVVEVPGLRAAVAAVVVINKKKPNFIKARNAGFFLQKK